VFVVIVYVWKLMEVLKCCRKYEEISPPKVDDFCYITDNTFSKQDVVKMEADILLALQFELGRPTINTFMRLDLCVLVMITYWFVLVSLF